MTFSSNLATEAFEAAAEYGAAASRPATEIVRGLPEIAGPGSAERLSVAAHTLEPAAMDALVTKLVTNVKRVLGDTSLLTRRVGDTADAISNGVGEANRQFGFARPEVTVDYSRAYGGWLGKAAGHLTNSYAVSLGQITIDAETIHAPFALIAKAAEENSKPVLEEAGAELAKAVAHENTHYMHDVLKTRRYIDLNPKATVADWFKSKMPNEKLGTSSFNQAKAFFNDVLRLRHGRELSPALARRADILIDATAENSIVTEKQEQLIESGRLHLHLHLPDMTPADETQYAKFWNELSPGDVPPSIAKQWEAIDRLVSSGAVSKAQAGKDFYLIAHSTLEGASREWDALYQQYRNLADEQEAHAVGDMAGRIFLALS